MWEIRALLLIAFAAFATQIRESHASNCEFQLRPKPLAPTLRSVQDIAHSQRNRLLGNEAEPRQSYILGTQEVLDLVEERRLASDPSHFECRIFGHPVTEAVRRGFQITNFGFFEKSPMRASDLAALRARKLLESQFPGSRLTVLEPFCGIGQDTWSFTQHGFLVQASDRDPVSVEVAKHNLQIAGMSTHTTFEVQDATTLLPQMKRGSNNYGLVYLDPPWQRGIHRDHAMHFTDYQPNLAVLIRQGLDIAPLVGVKVAIRNINSTEISKFSAENGLSYELNPSGNLGIIFFWRKKA